MARSKHTHKYQKVKLGDYMLWSCALPDCMHFMPKHFENLIPGKASYCWKCEESMIMGAAQLRMNKPLCDDCLMGRAGTLADILPEVPTIEDIHNEEIDSIIPSEISIEEKFKKLGIDGEGLKRMSNLMANPDKKE